LTLTIGPHFSQVSEISEMIETAEPIVTGFGLATEAVITAPILAFLGI
jgi:hypothetical protein